jgi:hypothetical protein
MKVLVSDTSVLVDLERGDLLDACFRLPYEDNLFDGRVLDADVLVSGLESIAAHPRCRLPRGDIQSRLERYRQGFDKG